MATYSQEFKESLVKKVLNSPNKTMSGIAREAQVSVSTLHTWVHRHKHTTQPNVAKINSSNDSATWTAAQRFQTLLDTAHLAGESLSEYCRQHGLYKHQLEQWRKEFMSDIPDSKQHRNELKHLRDQNKTLQRELRRKEKALAEASALLILKKKANLIWPDDEDGV